MKKNKYVNSIIVWYIKVVVFLTDSSVNYTNGPSIQGCLVKILLSNNIWHIGENPIQKVPDQSLLKNSMNFFMERRLLLWERRYVLPNRVTYWLMSSIFHLWWNSIKNRLGAVRPPSSASHSFMWLRFRNETCVNQILM